MAKGLKVFLKEAWLIAKESVLYPGSTTYYDENLNVTKREPAKDPGYGTLLKEIILHPLSTSHFDDDGNVVKRRDSRGNVTYPQRKI